MPYDDTAIEMDRPSLPPIEDTRFVLGKGRYVNDVVLPGMLHLATVPSPHAHARIIRIDTHKAAQAPGVITVIA